MKTCIATRKIDQPRNHIQQTVNWIKYRRNISHILETEIDKDHLIKIWDGEIIIQYQIKM